MPWSLLLENMVHQEYIDILEQSELISSKFDLYQTSAKITKFIQRFCGDGIRQGTHLT